MGGGTAARGVEASGAGWGCRGARCGGVRLKVCEAEERACRGARRRAPGAGRRRSERRRGARRRGARSRGARHRGTRR